LSFWCEGVADKHKSNSNFEIDEDLNGEDSSSEDLDSELSSLVTLCFVQLSFWIQPKSC